MKSHTLTFWLQNATISTQSGALVMDFILYLEYTYQKKLYSVKVLSDWMSQTKTSTMFKDINTNSIILVIQYFHDLTSTTTVIPSPMGNLIYNVEAYLSGINTEHGWMKNIQYRWWKFIIGNIMIWKALNCNEWEVGTIKRAKPVWGYVISSWNTSFYHLFVSRFMMILKHSSRKICQLQ